MNPLQRNSLVHTAVPTLFGTRALVYDSFHRTATPCVVSTLGSQGQKECGRSLTSRHGMSDGDDSDYVVHRQPPSSSVDAEHGETCCFNIKCNFAHAVSLLLCHGNPQLQACRFSGHAGLVESVCFLLIAVVIVEESPPPLAPNRTSQGGGEGAGLVGRRRKSCDCVALADKAYLFEHGSAALTLISDLVVFQTNSILLLESCTCRCRAGPPPPTLEPPPDMT